MGNHIMGLNTINIIFTVHTNEKAVIPVLLRPLLQPMKVTLTPQKPHSKKIKFQDLTVLVQKTLKTLSYSTNSNLYKIEKIEHIQELYNSGGLLNTLYSVFITVHFFSKNSLDTFFQFSRDLSTSKRNRTNNTIEELQINDFIISKNYSKSSDILLTLPYEQPKSESVMDLVTKSLPLINEAAKVVHTFKKGSQGSS
jgi:hypothetical protein